MFVWMNSPGPWMERSTCDFGGEVDDRARPVLAQQRVDLRGSPMSPRTKTCRGRRDRLQVAEVAGVRELVEVDDGLARGGEPVEHEVGADEAGAAGDEDHGVSRGSARGRDEAAHFKHRAPFTP
jgi:hypothetical protein